MRIEIQNWWKQAEADIQSARNCIQSGDYYLAVFMCQQSAEKALKSACLSKLKEIPKGHSLIYLAQVLKIPSDLMSAIRKLNPEYITTRYPDVAQGVPAELYDKPIADAQLKSAEAVMKWARSQMKE